MRHEVETDTRETRSCELAGWLFVGAILVLAVGVYVALSLGKRAGVDFRSTFYEVIRRWVAGETRLYDGRPGGYYHPPWAIVALSPLALVDPQAGLILLTLVTVATLAAAVLLINPPSFGRNLALVLVLFNLHTADLINRGQLVFFGILGILLGWLAYRDRRPWLMGFALILMSIDVPNTIPLLLLFLWWIWQNWPRYSILVSFVPPLVVFLGSFVVFGNWLARWLHSFQAGEPLHTWRTTIWQAASQLHLPAVMPWLIVLMAVVGFVCGWRKTRALQPEVRDRIRLLLVVTATFIATPYSLSYRMMLALVFVFPYVAERSIPALLALYTLTFTPLLRLTVGVENAWIDIVIILAAFGMLLYYAAVPPVDRDQVADGES